MLGLGIRTFYFFMMPSAVHFAVSFFAVYSKS